MGQPYIELRHRAPEHRLRMAFAPEPQQGSPLGQLVLEQQQQLAPPTAPLAQAAEAVLPGSDGMEEHLEGEDSAVKDLEDVEVKDLVDLNLNLDTEDGRPCPPRSSGARVHQGSSRPSINLLSRPPLSPGKEDLDLGPNDLHLDDFLLSGKFDLIAYADPELDLEDKKDMFNEELDLGEAQAEERARRLSDGQVKQEVVDDLCGGHSRTPRGPGGEAAGLLGKVSRSISSMIPADQSVTWSSSSLRPLTLCVSQVEASVSSAQDQGLSVGVAPRANSQSGGGDQSISFIDELLRRTCWTHLSPLIPGQQSVFQQRPFGPVPPHPMPLQSTQAHLLLNNQNQVQDPDQDEDPDRGRPLLLEEQPLLLQELLDQERQEQQQQKQMQALIRHRATPEAVVPNMGRTPSAGSAAGPGADLICLISY